MLTFDLNVERKLKLGISTYSFPWAIGVAGFLPRHPMTAEALINYAVRKKISHVQFADNFPLHLLDDKELDHLKDLADNNHIQLETGTRRLTVDHILSYLAIARKLQSPFMRVVIDDQEFKPGADTIIDTILELLPYLKEAGVILAIENHDRLGAAILEEIVLRTSTELVGICLDTVNSVGANEGLGQILPILLPYTVNLHVKDFVVERVPDKMGFVVRGTPAGGGMLAIPELLESVKVFRKCRSATLEIWMDREKTIEETIAKEEQWVESSIDYLIKYIA